MYLSSASVSCITAYPKKKRIYQAAMMDPHMQSELSIDDIVSLCDEMIEAYKGWLPEYK